MVVAGHDLRQPLQIMLGAIEKIAPECRDESQLFWLSAARDAASRLNQGLTDLAISGHSRTAIIEMRDIPLAALFDRLEADWAPSAWQKGLALRFIRPSYLVHSNAALLLTIVSNLIGNAIKHTTAGRVVVGCRKLGHAIAVDVVDTGPGFGRELRDRMFEAFEKGDAKKEGLGLGLWLVAQSCRTLGHRVEAKSTPGWGSRFRVILPGPNLTDCG
ncbi:HAMP domain-containing sensor histidine kinase [Sphingomonas sp. BIUV-7]|uniref:histidine kinase n=1 Tax=Sphingomonas natans TaxID=3063330 RepID=A0ABT8Y7A2_9SPHN|nr:HAMP domain-containing sensor histidine kinase [Sphingomonas sp. BIUV-7]MDO6414202.1 HAMP domain-containing sensor histidine kinase [Sphingomonas sp. BIUV-7]